jgi:hypothetical protein
MTEQGVFYNAKVDHVYRARETYNLLYTDYVESFCTCRHHLLLQSLVEHNIVFIWVCLFTNFLAPCDTGIPVLDPKMAIFE